VRCGRRFNKDCLDECLIVRALSGLCVGLVLTNSAGKVIWLNPAAERALGLSGSNCLDQPLNRMLKDPQLAAFWQKAAETKGNLLADVRVRWPEQLVLKLNATRYIGDDGQEIGRALLFCDVTAEQAVQLTLSQAVAERLLALTAGHMPPDPVAHLTHQEVRILRLVGQGLRNDEIAEQAHISASTVRSHLKSVYRKLKLGSRAEAVSYAIRNHLV
jgi:DNA-binding CsgD family transcriptional regulator